MATFPREIAAILKSDRTEEADYGMLRTEMDGGIAKQRARWTTPIRKRDVTIQVRTTVDRFAFDTWMRDDLRGGAGWFSWTDLDGSIKQARLVGGALRWVRAGGDIWNGQAQIETVG